MYKKILVPLDGSERAEAILPHVEELATNRNSEIILLNVIEPQFVYSDQYGFSYVGIKEISQEEKQKQAKVYLSGLEESLRKKGFELKSIVADGSIAHTILRIAIEEDVDLIAMASHGRTGLAHVFYGSVAASVLHLVDRPLFLIRA